MRINTDIELLFYQVEEELARRWVVRDLPTPFLVNPQTAIRTLIKACWQLYQESVCAAEEVDRTVWQQPKLDGPMSVLNTSDLVTALGAIHRSINIGALVAYRPLLPPESAAIELLFLVVSFYVNQINQSYRAWTQIS